jgi:hypothetical protein
MESRPRLDRGRPRDPRLHLILKGWYDPDSAAFASDGDPRRELASAADGVTSERDETPSGAHRQLIGVSSR